MRVIEFEVRDEVELALKRWKGAVDVSDVAVVHVWDELAALGQK